MEARNSRILRIILLLIAVCLFGYTAEAKYGGGTGEPNDPYKIATVEDLMLLGENSRDFDKHFILIADIDLDPSLPGRRIFYEAVIAASFTGVFDGNGHTISNLTMRGDDHVGLFRYLESGAEIRNLGMVDVDIVSTGYNAGGLASSNLWGSVINCYSTGRIRGHTRVGGLVGHNDYFGRITCSYAACTVTGEDSVGGLAGRNGNIIAHCYATGDIEGITNVGGLVGMNRSLYGGGTITNCYATGSVSGVENVGGMVGASDYWRTDPITFSFWDIEASGQETSGGGTGKTTAQMQDPNTFIAAGWDFVGESGGPSDIWAERVGGVYPILWWQLSPTLPLPTFSGGAGEPDDPYLISTASELNSIGHNPRLMGAYFKLMNDIDLEGINFYIISTEAFPYTGVFDGDGFMISNLNYNSNGTNYAGLFRYISGPAEIKDLGLSEPNVDGRAGDSVGSLVGYLSEGKVTGCHVNRGSVKGRQFVGGLVGSNYKGAITNCYSSATVSGEWSIGGLVGEDWRGTISGCYSSDVISSGEAAIGGLAGYINTSTIINSYVEGGDVSGDMSVGGFVGLSTNSTVANCYSTSSVTGNEDVGGLIGEGGFAHNSFWSILPLGPSISPGGKGRTTDQMQMARTFLGWNGCGNEGVWTIDDGNDYPRLSWENRSGEVLETQQLSDLLTGAGTEEEPYLIYTAEELNVIGLFPCEWDKHFKLMADIDLSQYSGTEFNVIGIPNLGEDYIDVGIPSPFSSVFDGNGKKITNFSHTRGLFMYVTGTIKDLGLIDANVNTESEYWTGSLVGYLFEGTITGCYAEGGSVSGGFFVRAGGLVGGNSGGTITKCYAMNNVSGDSAAGGLVGFNNGDLMECYSAGSVSGDNSDVGGLVGENSDTIIDCYATGSVSSSGDYSSVGGLVGENWGMCTIANCYSSGSVTGTADVGGLVGVIDRWEWGDMNLTEVTSSFWDVQTSGQETSAGGTGKTTVEMQTASTFIDEGWDFVDETDNGTEYIWWIDEGQDYPRLWWELIPEN